MSAVVWAWNRFGFPTYVPRVEVSPVKNAKRCKICGELEKKSKIGAHCDECGEKTFKR